MLGSSKECRSSIEVAGIDIRAVSEEKFDDIRMPGLCCVREWHCAEAIARRERSAIVKQSASEFDTTFVGSSGKSSVDFQRSGCLLYLSVTLLLFLADAHFCERGAG